ncbi:MAG TPA: hypothetical protein VJT75_18340 [Thermoleophilaceae bacterium]|nr:hypothetical protein [Thermoleophilaceae bacterium]
MRDEYSDKGQAPSLETADRWLDAVFEEYRTIRAEASPARGSVLRFGFTILGAVIGLGVSLREKGILGGVILAGVVPFLVVFTLEFWISEVERSVRAGAFVAAIEKRLEKFFHPRPRPAGWENWLRLDRPTRRARRAWFVPQLGTDSEHPPAWFFRGFVVLVVLAFAYGVSVATGLHYLWHLDHRTWFWVCAGLAASILLFVVWRVVFALTSINERDKPPDPEVVWPDPSDPPESEPSA